MAAIYVDGARHRAGTLECIATLDDAGLADLAHGLLNSLAAIKGAAEVLQKQGVGTTSINEQCLKIIMEQSQVIASVLHGLMANSTGD